MNARNECHHGSLRRSCDRCDMEQEIIELRIELDRTRRALAKAAEEIARLIRSKEDEPL